MSSVSYWRRLIQTASPGAQQRFIETFDMFFQAITEQARDRANGIIPDLESYIAIRRDTSGCKPCWALIEYANNVSVPALLPERADVAPYSSTYRGKLWTIPSYAVSGRPPMIS